MLNAIVNKRSKPASRVIDRRLNDRVYVCTYVVQTKTIPDQVESRCEATKPRA